MKILIINGSHRQGNTDILVGHLVDKIKEGGNESKVLVLREIEMKLPDGCEFCAESEICPNIKDEFSEKIEPAIRDYDVYIAVTPTWSDGVTPLTKIFWDRIVFWSHDDRKYLRGKKLAIATHGMADEKSWILPINWVKSVCVWEKCQFGGSLVLKSGAKIGSIEIDEDKIKSFVDDLLKW